MRVLSVAYVTAVAASVSIVAACSTAQTASVATSVNTTLATAQSDLATAVAFYQTAKGIALVAEVAQPKLAGSINIAIGILDPLVATAQAALTAANGDAPAMEALVSQITTQAVLLEQTAAPAVKVIKS